MVKQLTDVVNSASHMRCRYIFPGTSCDDEDEELVPNERIEKECKENWKARLVTL